MYNSQKMQPYPGYNSAIETRKTGFIINNLFFDDTVNKKDSVIKNTVIQST